jgi:hypothetical protein
MAFIIQFGLLVASLLSTTASVTAAEFPPKPETIKQIILGSVDGVVVARKDPRASTKTITSTHSTRGYAFSTSETFDSTPERPNQVLRFINNSIYDLKDRAIDCFYVSESGTPVGGSKSHTFLLVFPASSRRDVSLPEISTQRYARSLACSIKDFEYIGIGEPPKPEPPRSGAPANGTARPVVDEWGIRGRSKVY